VLAEPLGRFYLPPEERADIARWVVALRRAHHNGTGQTKGNLGDRVSYCCLGIQCRLAEADGRLESRLAVVARDAAYTLWRPAGIERAAWEESTLPMRARLARSQNPPIFSYLPPEHDRDDEADPEYDFVALAAADLNDHHELNFAQIADLVAWSFAITPEELAAAEAAPRVESIEGVAA
jgi:hypothetical protein